ncbi:mobile element protein [Kitasatospora sp. NPDC059646]|uniref:mobile element protein n=1 Tax=Kitasatospora sp. NPDC059646 TaxID=3346893 RepID=UPI0036B99FFC
MALPPDGLLAFPADLATWLKVPADDPNLLLALRSASSRFIADVRHPVRLVTGDTTTLYGDGTDRLLLPAAPVGQVASVTVDGTAVTDWKVRRDIGALLRTSGCGWPSWSEVVLVWDHGLDPIPQDVQDAVIGQARVVYAVLPGVQTVQAGGESMTYGAAAATGVTAEWTSAVSNYQLAHGDRT